MEAYLCFPLLERCKAAVQAAGAPIEIDIDSENRTNLEWKQSPSDTMGELGKTHVHSEFRIVSKHSNRRMPACFSC